MEKYFITIPFKSAMVMKGNYESSSLRANYLKIN